LAIPLKILSPGGPKVDRKVRRHAERLIVVWRSFRVISYTLQAGRMIDNRWLLRPACIEDAPEMLRVLKCDGNIFGHDFGAVPSLMGDDASTVNIARRHIEGFDEEMLSRELDCGRLLEIMDARGIHDPALILAAI
jgi:hypothetical protein